MNKEELEKFLKEKGVSLIIGAYGEEAGCEGLVQEIIESPEGTFTRFVGCSYLFKGFPRVDYVEALAVPKKLLNVAMSLANTFIGRMLILSFLLFPKWTFKKYIVKFLGYYRSVCYGVLIRMAKPEEKFRISVREIRRTANIIIDRYFPKTKFKLDANIFFHFLKDSISFFLDYDFAYNARLQDILPLIDKKALKKNPIKEIKRVYEIYKERELCFPEKVKNLDGLMLFLRFSKPALRLVVDFLLELDFDKIKLDEADYYFCLRRHTYKFKGKTLEERKKEKAIIDKEKGHNIPNIVFKPPEKNEPIRQQK